MDSTQNKTFHFRNSRNWTSREFNHLVHWIQTRVETFPLSCRCQGSICKLSLPRTGTVDFINMFLFWHFCAHKYYCYDKIRNREQPESAKKVPGSTPFNNLISVYLHKLFAVIWHNQLRINVIHVREFFITQIGSRFGVLCAEATAVKQRVKFWWCQQNWNWVRSATRQRHKQNIWWHGKCLWKLSH